MAAAGCHVKSVYNSTDLLLSFRESTATPFRFLRVPNYRIVFVRFKAPMFADAARIYLGSSRS